MAVAPEELLARVNKAVEEGYLRNQAGEGVKEPVGEGLVREDGKVLYPVREDIPILLLDEAIRLDALS